MGKTADSRSFSLNQHTTPLDKIHGWHTDPPLQSQIHFPRYTLTQGQCVYLSIILLPFRTLFLSYIAPSPDASLAIRDLGLPDYSYASELYIYKTIYTKTELLYIFVSHIAAKHSTLVVWIRTSYERTSLGLVN